MVDLGVSQQIISAEQRKRYESDGYLHLNGFVDTGSLEELRNTANEFVEASRKQSASDKLLDLSLIHI